ncbi:hypothetical protein GE09DRAFT_1127340 [Coniochaeta sp. 2T2.1]|nr:hypothetical protein GE09DRAFT_1127340 [Coniochaeta sp. 2T2.1]
MATSREERMASRLRGAGRHNVEDISFDFVIPEESIIDEPAAPPPPYAEPSSAAPPISPPPPPATAPRSANPNTSAKRRRLDPSQSPSTSRTPAVAPLAPPPSVSLTRSGRGSSINRAEDAAPPRASPRDVLRRSAIMRTPRTHHTEADEDELESLPRPTPRSATRTTREEIVEIVQESPADAPGSGRRKRVVRVSEVASSAGAALQRAMLEQQGQSQKRKTQRLRVSPEEEEEEDELTAEVDVSPVLAQGSSPLVRRAEREKGKSGKKRKAPQEEREEEDDEVTARVGSSISPLARKATKNAAKKTAAQRQEKPAPAMMTGRRLGVGAAGFGLDVEVDELSPAPAKVASPATGAMRKARVSDVSAEAGVDELSPLVARTSRRSMRPARVVADEDEADELSPAPTKIAKRGAKPVTKSTAAATAAEDDAPTPVRTGKRTTRPRAEAVADEDEIDELSPAPAQATRRGVKPAPAKTAPEVDAPTPLSARSSRRRPTPLDDTGADELDEPSPAPARGARRSVRVSDVSMVMGEDELSPEKTQEAMGPPPRPRPQKDKLKSKQQSKQPAKAPPVAPGKARRSDKQKPAQVQAEEPAEEPEEEEEADEISATEAAQRLGRKRPRRSLQAPAEEEHSQQDEDQEEEPAAKRRRKKPPQSPAKQQPHKTRKEKNGAVPASQRPPKPQPAKKRQTKASAAEDEAPNRGGAIGITVQRFTGPPRSPDPLSSSASAIPFSSRSGANTIDVLSELCASMLDAYVFKLREQGRAAAQDPAARRECKAKINALELFGEELRTRLLEHTIALDTLHALRKRVRQAQRERVGLREEILRLRREREEVEVRKDAVRVRHEREREVALANIGLSSTMHDIDLAVEKGVSAKPLSAAEQSQAELANLEFLIGRVAEQACSKNGQGGTLKQIRDFNAFLERAAAALEGR